MDRTPPSAADGSPLGGLSQSLRGLAATAMAIAQTRLELLSTELEQEKRRLLRVMAWGAVAVFLGCMGLMSLGILVAVLFWDTHRVLVLSLLTLLLWGGCGGILWWIRTHLQSPAEILGGTLAELEHDRQALAPRPPEAT